MKKSDFVGTLLLLGAILCLCINSFLFTYEIHQLTDRVTDLEAQVEMLED